MNLELKKKKKSYLNWKQLWLPVEQIRNFSVEQFCLWKLLIWWTEMVPRIHQSLSNFPAYLASSLHCSPSCWGFPSSSGTLIHDLCCCSVYKIVCSQQATEKTENSETGFYKDSRQEKRFKIHECLWSQRLCYASLLREKDLYGTL